MLLATGVVVAMVSVILWWLLRRSEYDKKIATIPGPAAVPIFGNALQLKSDTFDFFKQLLDWCDHYERFSALFKMALGSHHMVYIFHAETAEKILGSTANIAKAFSYRFAHPWLQTGLLTSTGKKWHSRRKLLTPTFHFKILVDFLEVFNEQANVLIERLAKKCDGTPFDIFPFITLCTLDIICEAAMGKKIDAQILGGESEYVTAVSGLSYLIVQRIRSPWKWNDFIYKMTGEGKRHDTYLKTLHGFTQKVINERIKEMKETPETFGDGEASGSKHHRAFLDLLLHMAQDANFTIKDIQEEVDTFMFEGHDTTAAGIAWTIQKIGSHPDIQKGLHDEMDQVFGDSDRPCTIEDILHMKYLECVIKESMRLLPPVPIIGRSVDEDIQVDDMVIPKGASLSILVWRVNRDPKHFTDPEKFDPERFRFENSIGRHPFAYIPFSAGSRNCIGQKFALNEEKCVLSSILRRYCIESTQSIDEIRPIAEMILRPTKGIKVKLTKRA